MTSSGKRPRSPAARAPALRALRWGAREGETAKPASWAHKLKWEAGQPAALVLSLVRESARLGPGKKNAASLALVRSSRPAWSRGGAGRRSPDKLAPRSVSAPFPAAATPGRKFKPGSEKGRIFAQVRGCWRLLSPECGSPGADLLAGQGPRALLDKQKLPQLQGGSAGKISSDDGGREPSPPRPPPHQLLTHFLPS